MLAKSTFWSTRTSAGPTAAGGATTRRPLAAVTALRSLGNVVMTGGLDGSTCRCTTASRLPPPVTDTDADTDAPPDGLSAVTVWLPAGIVRGPTMVLAAAPVATALPSTVMVIGLSATPWTT